MTTGYQYGEGAIIEKFFGPTDQMFEGWLVDVGAADGVDNSNSYELIKNGWKGLLIEPNPVYYYRLQELYGNNNNAKLCPFGVANTMGYQDFCANRQCSSFKYHAPNKLVTKVMCMQLSRLCEIYHVPKYFDFLSVDCEGTDMEVLASLDFNIYQPRLVCVEHSMPFEELNKFMYEHGYEFLDKTLGNSFFRRR